MPIIRTQWIIWALLSFVCLPASAYCASNSNTSQTVRDYPLRTSAPAAGHPHPQQSLSTLRSLAPKIRRVIVVLDPHRFGWLIKPATAAARAERIELVIHQTDNFRKAATFLSKALNHANRETDAIWLLDEDPFFQAEIFPRLIEKSIARKMIIYSTSPEQVRRGVLFSLHQDPSQPDKLLKTINLRTAARIRIHLSPEVLRQFDVVIGEYSPAY